MPAVVAFGHRRRMLRGEVNGMMTYDRRVLRPDVKQWNSDLQALYDAAAARSNSTARLI